MIILMTAESKSIVLLSRLDYDIIIFYGNEVC